MPPPLSTLITSCEKHKRNGVYRSCYVQLSGEHIPARMCICPITNGRFSYALHCEVEEHAIKARQQNPTVIAFPEQESRSAASRQAVNNPAS